MQDRGSHPQHGISDMTEAPPPPEGHGRLHDALDLLIAEVEAAQKELRRADAAAVLARSRRQSLTAAAERLIRALPMRERTRHHRRLSALLTELVPRGKGRPRPNNRAAALREFLARLNADTFRVAEATSWLEARGWPVTPRSAGTTILDMEKQGYVTRVSHGVYRVNRLQPVLLDLQLAILDEEKKRILRS